MFPIGNSFPRAYRVTLKKDFSTIFSTGVRRTFGPLLFHVSENTIGHSRLGLSIPRRVGNAVMRNRIKRRCREAFRQSKDVLPAVDIIITVRPHDELSLDGYTQLLLKAVE
ncbi:MAG: ribonuclease P protein component [Planctomycetes bacterium]|nr:ribonuclease P protein component [Planctomycetota bacterium]